MNFWHSDDLIIWIIEEGEKRWRWFARKLHQEGSYHRSCIYKSFLLLQDDLQLFLLRHKLAQPSIPAAIIDWESSEILGLNLAAQNTIATSDWRPPFALQERKQKLAQNGEIETYLPARWVLGEIFWIAAKDKLLELPSGRKVIFTQAILNPNPIPFEGSD